MGERAEVLDELCSRRPRDEAQKQTVLKSPIEIGQKRCRPAANAAAGGPACPHPVANLNAHLAESKFADETQWLPGGTNGNRSRPERGVQRTELN